MSEAPDMQTFMLESLQDEQRTILRLMEQAARVRAPEAGELDWALETTVSAYRSLKAGQIGWWGAVQAYQQASNAALDCDRAMFERRMGWESEGVLP